MKIRLKVIAITQQSTTSQAVESKQETSDEASQDTNSEIVYITNTGEKYHRVNCSYLKKSKIEITLSEAQQRGYIPCSKCY